MRRCADQSTTMRRTSHSIGVAQPPPLTLPPPPPPQQQVKQKQADIDEVKRRWIRQNRDLAKSNSGQSLRIRALEQEVARLQADNLSLRGELVAARRAACAAEVAGVRRLRDEMRAKIIELSGLVDGIDGELETEEQERAWEEQLQRNARPLPADGVWRERQPLAELMRDSQMPTIAEEKAWPRRTLGADEVEPLRASSHRSSGGSPDLGPPPIAHFDYEDPVKSASPLASKVPTELALSAEGDGEALPASLSMNLETRRRRKQDTRRISLLPRSPGETENATTSPALRTGAKRKLADREPEKAVRTSKESDFNFTRRAGKDSLLAEAEETDNASVQQEGLSKVDLPPPQSPAARKVLGNKSVNLSPRKAQVAASGKTEKPFKPDQGKEKPERPQPSRFTATRDTASRRRSVSIVPMQSTAEQNVVDTVEIRPPSPQADEQPETVPDVTSEAHPVPPITPAPAELFSPTPSEASVRAETGVRGDTPPPALGLSGLRGMTSDSMGYAGSRPSRRARAAVNYAEPSLVAKMRRPDKKLVDAVGGLQDLRRTISTDRAGGSVSSDNARTGVDDAKQKPTVAVEVKCEEEDGGGDVEADAAWKALPPATSIESGSPLAQKAQAATAAATSAQAATTNFDDVLMPALAGDVVADEPERRAQVAKPAALARRRRSSIQVHSGAPKGSSTAQLSEIEAIDRNASAASPDDADIYEFKDSSPLPSRARVTESSSVDRKALPSKRSDAQSEGLKERSTSTPSVLTTGSKRRSSMMPIREAESRGRATSVSATVISAATSVAEGAGLEDGAVKGRRTASGSTAGDIGRRRSMML